MGQKAKQKNYMSYLSWLRWILMLFVRPKVPQSKESLNLIDGKHVCYVLRTGSLSDSLVLDHCCSKVGLPRPIASVDSIDQSEEASKISLLRLGWLSTSRRGSRVPPPKLFKVLRSLKKKPDSADVQLVPVTVIWGRSPLSEEKSSFKAFFSDDVNAGIIQKLFIILFQGRNTMLQFGEPISLRSQIEQDEDLKQTARKLRRVLRVHFHRQRSGIVGPRTVDRRRVVAAVMASKTVKDLIKNEVVRSKTDEAVVEERVRKILNEIIANQKHSVIRGSVILLKRLWAKTIRDGIQVRGLENLFELAKNNEIIFAPNHRSHFDYLMHSYVLHNHGLPAPHIAAGVNLNFWPVGRILRMGGAFFIRRQFKGDRLYPIIFREYLNYLIMRGHSITFYPEGGRSRTGHLLAPKTGMLSMIVQSYLRGTDRPVVIVPCNISYDRVIEIRSYMRELSGKKKRKESIFELMKFWRFLGNNYGQAYVSFGDPIYLKDYIDDDLVADSNTAEVEQKPQWLTPVINRLSRNIMENITAVSSVGPTNLIALALLSNAQKSMGESELAECIEFLRDLIKNSEYNKNIDVTNMSGLEVIKHSEELEHVRRFNHPGGDVIYLHDMEGFLLGYYRNNILYLLAVPALIASFFQHNDSMSLEELKKSCRLLFPFLKVEMFLPWDTESFNVYLDGLIADFEQLGLLSRNGDQIMRAQVSSEVFAHLMLLGRVLGQTFDRFAVVAALLGKTQDGEKLDRIALEKQSQLMAQRISLLAGKNAPEFSDRRLFSNYLDILKKQEYIHQVADGKVVVDQKISQLYDCSVHLLGADMRKAIQRMRFEEAPRGDL